MFFDYKPMIEDLPPDPLSYEASPEWKRVERRIYSRKWRAAHNLIAHPMLVVYRPLGEWLHEYTARKMYEPIGDLPPIVTDKD